LEKATIEELDAQLDAIDAKIAGLADKIKTTEELASQEIEEPALTETERKQREMELAKHKMRIVFGQIDATREMLTAARKEIQVYEAMDTALELESQDNKAKIEGYQLQLLTLEEDKAAEDAEAKIPEAEVVEEVTPEAEVDPAAETKEETKVETPKVIVGASPDQIKELMAGLEARQVEVANQRAKIAAEKAAMEATIAELEAQLVGLEVQQDDLMPEAPECLEGQLLVEGVCKDDLLQKSLKATSSSSAAKPAVDYEEAYASHLKSGNEDIAAPLESQVETAGERNWGYIVGWAVAAGLGSLVLMLSVAKCNRDKKNAFEEMGDTRIYLEGEDLNQYQEQQ